MLNRVYNFSAGPSTLPLSVMQKIKEDFLDYNGTGVSIIEISHRNKIFRDILHSANHYLESWLTFQKIIKYFLCMVELKCNFQQFL